MLNKIKKYESIFYKNTETISNSKEFLDSYVISYEDILDASKRLDRFAPLIKILFPETSNGIIESPLVEGLNIKEKLYPEMLGRLFLKLDSHLEVAGSIKARGGIYEVLKYTEDLLIKNNLLSIKDNYSRILTDEIQNFLSKYTISVASTGNLGLSIGIMSSSLGYKSIVHMSNDAKEWKKIRLRKKGVQVVEHNGDFTFAVSQGRKQAESNPLEYFVDDEKSSNLFLGYAVAALRLKSQLEQKNIKINEDNPLYLYLPCGVGGAPGGITFGCKHVFNENVNTYFAEPTHSPSMLLSVYTKKYGELNVNDYGLDNITDLDGLAVAAPSDFISKLMEKLCNGFYTVKDEETFKYLYLLKKYEDIKIEPSAAVGLKGPKITCNIKNKGIHIVWTTGGIFVPDEVYNPMYEFGKSI